MARKSGKTPVTRTTDHSAVGRRSKNKGRRGEYWLRDQLRSALGIEFERTPQSGGSQLKEGWKLGGDVAAPPGVDWRWCLEMKWREGWRLEQLFSPKCDVWEWWLQVLEDAGTTGLDPVLIFKRNNVQPLVMTLSSAFPPECTLPISTLVAMHPTVGSLMYIMLFEDWLNLLKDEVLKNGDKS